MKQIYLAIILCVLHFVNVVNSKLVLIGDNSDSNKYNIKCVSSNYSEVLVAAFPLSSTPTFLDARNNYVESLRFVNGLTEFSSKNNYLGLVLDERWESFPIVYTIGPKHSNSKITDKDVGTLGLNTNRFGLSILAQYEAHIYICQEFDATFSVFRYCYWVLLGGWAGEKSALRYCYYNYIPQFNGVSPKDAACSFNRDEIAGNPLSESQWQHFEFSLDASTRRFSVYRNGDTHPYLTTNYTDPYYSITSLTNIRVSSRKQNAYFKFHDYNYVRKSSREDYILIQPQNSSICISMYVYVKQSTYVTLQISEISDGIDKLIKEESFAINQNFWTKITSKTFGLMDDRDHKILIKKSNYYEEIYISNLERHLNCFQNEFRYIEFLSQSRFQNVGCTTIRNEEIVYLELDKKRDADDFRCLDTQFSQSCISCMNITNNEYCNKNFVCEFVNNEYKCYCTIGYMGYHCEKECPNDKFGLNCEKNCTKCKYNVCNSINGQCESGCADNYIEPECTQPLNPFLINSPKIVGDCLPSACDIKIDETQNGTNDRAYFKIKYKQQGGRHIKWMEMNTTDLTYSIEGLQIGKTYDLVVLICTYNNTCYDGDEVPKLAILNVTCHAPKQSDFIIDASTNSATIVYKGEELADACPNSEYYYESKNIKAARNVIKHVISNQQTINYLDPFSTYNVSVKAYNTNEELFVLSFSTKEAAPGPIRNFTANTVDTNIYISWEEPRVPNGIIRLYSITYEIYEGLYCNTPLMQSRLQRIESINVTRREHVLSNLMYYKRYKIVVTAYTTERGIEKTKFVDTPPSDQLDKYSFATQLVNITATWAVLNVKMDCDKITSNVALQATARCSDTWCENPIIRNITINNGLISQLYANSLYTISVDAINLNFRTSIQIFEGIFKTLPGVPNKIMFFDYYSKSANMVNLRWTEPYPPTGYLKKFKIIYRRSDRRIDNSVEFNVSTMARCHIWENMYCADVTNLMGQQYYNFEISAQNFDPDQFSDSTSIKNIFTQNERPGMPQHINYEWDDLYNLTLEWEHPNRTNGKLEEFQILINEDMEFHPVKREQLKYRRTFPIHRFSDFLNISIITKNKLLPSLASTIRITTPPPTPVCNSPPKATFSNNTIIVDIPFINNLLDNNVLYVIVAQNSSSFNSKLVKNFLDDYKNFTETSQIWVAVEQSNLTQYRTYSYIIGDNNMNDSKLLNTTIYNHALELNICYNIYVYISNSKNNAERHMLYLINICNQDFYYILWILLVVLLIAILIGVIIFIFITKKSKLIEIKERVISMRNSDKQPDVLPLADNIAMIAPMLTRACVDVKEEKEIEQPVAIQYSKPIKIAELENYIKEAIFNGELEKQHALFPRGVQKATNCGLLPENLKRNRYKNLIAYDETRVKLRTDGFGSDYINANYIKGLNNEIVYIATQGPKEETVADFWKMIWDEHVECIIMLANVLENGKKKTEKYWPNINESFEFKGIKIELLDSTVYSNYEHRLFKVTHDNMCRKIEQLHFTMWPDHGVPLYPQSLVPLLRRMLKIRHGRSPIVVHCSAGVGRTGTIILIDLSLRMASQKGYVDILYYQHQLREQRANMVDNIEQYKLAHLVIMECLVAPDTAIECNNKFEENLNAAIANDGDINKQMMYIKESAWQEEAINSGTKVPQTTYPEKNRFQNIVPKIYGLVYLTPNGIDPSSNYINAVTVDGYHMQQKFIATQQPLPNTVGDFWRMVVEYEASIVVSLQQIYLEDNTHCNFWPTNITKLLKIDDIDLEFISMEKRDNFEIITVNVTHKIVGRKVKILHCNKWTYNKSHPETATIILQIWEEMCKHSRNSNPIVVTCRDGATGCGLYIATCFILEKMKLEQICDVCQAVRAIRKSRKQFVASKVQFIFLYKIALAYYNIFVIYSNFA